MVGEPLTIALVYDDSLDRPGGVAQHVEMLRRGLSAYGHNVHLLVGQTRSEGASCHSLARNVAVRFNGNRLTVPLLASADRLQAALDEIAPDVLHVQLPYSPLLAGRLVARAHRRTAVVGTSHGFSERREVRAGARLLSVMSRRTHRRFDRVLAVSRPARYFAEHHSRMRVDAVVPNMVDTTAMQRMARGVQLADEPTVAYVGGLVPRKGVDRLLAAWPAVLEKHPAARLLIAGDGPLREALDSLARRSGVQRHVVFLGAVDEAEKARLLAGAHVACFPSLFGESFGIVLLEAMAAGTPIVLGGDNPGYREVLGGRPGILIDPRDPNRLGRALVDGISQAPHAELRRQLQVRVAARHDVMAVSEQVLRHYRLALVRRRGEKEHVDAGSRAA